MPSASVLEKHRPLRLEGRKYLIHGNKRRLRKQEYRPQSITIITTGIIIFFLLNAVFFAAFGLLSGKTFGAPIIPSIASMILGIWFLKDERKKNLAWGLLLGLAVFICLWISFVLALART